MDYQNAYKVLAEALVKELLKKLLVSDGLECLFYGAAARNLPSQLNMSFAIKR